MKKQNRVTLIIVDDYASIKLHYRIQKRIFSHSQWQCENSVFPKESTF